MEWVGFAYALLALVASIAGAWVACVEAKYEGFEFVWRYILWFFSIFVLFGYVAKAVMWSSAYMGIDYVSGSIIYWIIGFYVYFSLAWGFQKTTVCLVMGLIPGIWQGPVGVWLAAFLLIFVLTTLDLLLTIIAGIGLGWFITKD